MGENRVAMGYLNLSMEEPQNSHQMFMENTAGEAETGKCFAHSSCG